MDKTLKEDFWEELEKSINTDTNKSVRVSSFIEKCFNSKVFIKNIAPKFFKFSYQILVRFCLYLDDAYNKRIKNKEIFESTLNIILYATQELQHLESYLTKVLVVQIDDAFKVS